MDLSVLEIPCVGQIDATIEDLFSQRCSMIDCRSKEHQAYYYIKDYIDRNNYKLTVETVLCGYRYVRRGESYSCSVDSISRDCKKQCEILFNAGYAD